ncbi:MAG: hypothetical protein ISS70_15025 [Phycisphaerae bacterium]|nr:hypothetical protein [Phycisphaerae bacterium]
MKQIVPLLICGLSVFSHSGCHGSAESPPAVEVVVDGDGQFPDFLVGTWKADSGGWEIVFEPNGAISSAVVSLGVRMKPGEVSVVANKGGGEGVFEPGPWTVQYSQERRELIVEIVVAHFRTELRSQLGVNVVQGQRRDFFVGTVSGDGQLWWANRFSFPESVVDTKNYRDHELTVDPNDNPPEGLLFQKIPKSQ